MSAEEWRPVVGFEGKYEVSDQGRVRSLSRFVVMKDGKVKTLRGRVLRASANNRGYLLVGVGKQRPVQYVHRIVAAAFLGPCPAGQVVRHLNDVKTDNRVANLAYGTMSENRKDAYRNGSYAAFWASRTPQERLARTAAARAARWAHR